MMARRPVALSWQNVTCSCPSGDSGGAGGDASEGDAEVADDDMATCLPGPNLGCEVLAHRQPMPEEFGVMGEARTGRVE